MNIKLELFLIILKIFQTRVMDRATNIFISIIHTGFGSYPFNPYLTYKTSAFRAIIYW